MVPRNDIASTSYCLANPGIEYLVYLPAGGAASVDLLAASGDLTVEWFDPNKDDTRDGGTVAGGARRSFTSPFGRDAVLYLKAKTSSRRAK